MKKIAAIFSLFIICQLSACSNHQQNWTETNTLDRNQLANLQVAPIRYDNANPVLSQLRIKSLQDSAMSIGAQSGLAYASEQINADLLRNRKNLQTIYNFYALVLDHGVIPPILAEGNNSLNLDDPNTIRIVDKTYKIVAQARFATTPPNWREYLWMSFNRPELPDRTLLPKSNEEQAIWRRGIMIGWDKGVQQAYSIFQQNLARLKRDYNGMLLYRKLLAAKMISPPFVARTELGITGDGSDMRINDQVLRIVELPQLQTNSQRWQATVVTK